MATVVVTGGGRVARAMAFVGRKIGGGGRIRAGTFEAEGGRRFFGGGCGLT